MRISLIVAMGMNRVIGKDGRLPWHLPADLQHFKELTMNHVMIMGRKTFESIGRALPGRVSIVLTRTKGWATPSGNCGFAESLDAAISMFQGTLVDEIFIIGGAQVYKEAIDKVDRMYVTLIHENFVGDTFFPEIIWSEWELVHRVDCAKDMKNPHDYSFLIYDRKI